MCVLEHNALVDVLQAVSDQRNVQLRVLVIVKARRQVSSVALRVSRKLQIQGRAS